MKIAGAKYVVFALGVLELLTDGKPSVFTTTSHVFPLMEIILNLFSKQREINAEYNTSGFIFFKALLNYL